MEWTEPDVPTRVHWKLGFLRFCHSFKHVRVPKEVHPSKPTDGADPTIGLA